MREHPQVAFRDCEHCRQWLYDDETGKVRQRRVGTTKESTLVNIPRGDFPVACETSNGCPKGHYNNQKTLSDRNLMCYNYIKQGQAVNWNGVPVDGVVRRNASLIHDIESNADRNEQLAVMIRIGGLAALGRGQAK